MEQKDKQKAELKQLRRNKKGQLTRTIKSINKIVSADEDIHVETLTTLLKRAEECYSSLEEVHASLVNIIEGDDEFHEAEGWMEKAEEEYLMTHVKGTKVVQKLYAEETAQMSQWAQAQADQKTTADEEAASSPIGVEHQEGNESEGAIPDRRNDSSIMSVNTHNETMGNFDALKLALELPKAEVPEFYGDPGEYFSFIFNFQTNVAAKLSDNNTKLQYLIQFCKGKARQCIETCSLLGAQGYEQALSILESQFGQPHMVLNALMTNLTRRKQVNSGDIEALWSLVGAMKKCHVTLTKLGYVSDLNSTANLLKIQGLLPKYMQSKWVSVAHEILSKREPTFEDLLKFIEGQVAISSTMFGRQIGKESGGDKVENRTREGRVKENTGNKRLYHGVKNNDSNSSQSKCVCCKEASHRLWECLEFKRMDVDTRWDLAAKNKLCFKCLGGHLARQCSRIMHCNIDGCTKDHNRLLHRPKSTSVRRERVMEGEQTGEGGTSIEPGANDNHIQHNLMSQSKNISLRTVPVLVSAGNKTIEANVLLDDGSQQSYVNVDVTSELGITGEMEEVVASLLNGKAERFMAFPAELVISPVEGGKKYKIEALTTNNVTGNLKPVQWSRLSQDWEHLKDVKFPPFSRRREKIDILIGVDYPELHEAIEERKGIVGEPVARLTPLGWTCVGPVSKSNRVQGFHVRTVNTFKCSQVDPAVVDKTLTKFWQVESLGVIEKKASFHTPEEVKAYEGTKQSMTCVEGHRYQVKIPWKEDVKSSITESNLDVAEKRLCNLEKKLSKDQGLGDVYKDVLKEYLSKNYIRKVEEHEIVPKQQWFLPHFPVIKMDRDTTKVRIVYDASAEHKGVSLNDMILSGPKLQNDLFNVLLRFRREKVGVICDISEMYLQIMLTKEDKPMFRFLWRNLELDREPEVYEFNRLVFGVNAAPFISQVVIQQNAKMHEKTYPLAATAVLESTYMDDCMESVRDSIGGKKLYHELTELWARAGMTPRKWLSNSKEVMAEIAKELRAKEIKVTDNEWPSVKTLGLTWVADKDVFVFKGPEQRQECKAMTKRSVLSQIAALFDPLGVLSPVVIGAKILLQEIWASGTMWDEQIPHPLATKFQAWANGLKDLQGLEIPRCMRYFQSTGYCTELHVFVDASKDAYAAVAYTRCTNLNTGEVKCELISSKTKVAPLKSISIPRLELMAGMLGLKLAKSITEVLRHKLEDVIFWSDSTNVLCWIRGRSRSFKPFVANRVGEIQQQTNPSQWRYIPTKVNPADVASRGTTVLKLKEDHVWWNGPEYLKKNSDEWPVNKVESDDTISRDRKYIASLVAHREQCNGLDPESWRLHPNRFESWLRLTRVMAYVYRFINNCRSSVKNRVKGVLQPDEIYQAEMILIHQAQQEAFQDDVKYLRKNGVVNSNSVLSTLSPHFDHDGVLRMTGRLSLVETLPYDVRYPIILPRRHQVTRLIVRKYHNLCNHEAGTNHVLALMAEKYWVIHGREEIREYERNCMRCKRRKAKTAEQIMAPLPRIRANVSSLRAFTKVAIDYAGPFLTVQGRGKVRTKRYLCLFTCLVTRAVHLEMAYGMDSDTFLNAFYRFVSRRGVPEEVLSDNGSNFIGANRELRELYESLDKTRIQEVTANKGIKWTFIPPLTPHFGGVYESLIKSAKRAIYAILRGADITDEELHSAFVGAESILNSRPLTYMSASAKDFTPLTPNHFLHGSMGGGFASEILDTTRNDPRKRWRRMQELTRHFWNRWMKEWLPTLNQRKKWKEEKRDLAVNDVVLTVEKDTVKGQWPLGRIIEVFPGPDGHVRVVKIRTGKGDILRGITKVCPLEILE